MGEQPRWVVLVQAGGTALLLEVGQAGLPHVVHWGPHWGAASPADLAELVAGTARMDVDNVPDLPLNPGVLPGGWTGWSGRPGLLGHRDGGAAWSPRLRTTAVSFVATPADGGAPTGESAAENLAPGEYCRGSGTLTFTLTDPVAQLAVQLELRLTPVGTVQVRAQLHNEGQDNYHLHELNLALPLPLEVDEVLDFSGHWAKERCPQRRALTIGTHLREHRRGRPGFDATTCLLAGRPGFNFRRGQVYGLHVAAPANSRFYIERLPEGWQVLGGGELLHPGEVTLAPGQSYRGPLLHFTQGQGLDEAAGRFHDWIRSLPTAPGPARPVTLNVWEAVGFDQRLDKLLALADAAHALGVERFVLDDGWFLGRRDDTAGLGDWQVDPIVWPDGLTPLVERVVGHGMEFGLWFEPEMVNPNSQVAREHPDWLLAAHPELPVAWRHQQVLDLTNPQAWNHVHTQMDALLRRYPISYLKWDHNRDTFDAGSQTADRRAVAGEQVRCALRLMDRLRRDHPGLEIESCSSGGGRIDLETITHTQRFWVSDCLDPLERQAMLRWTLQLVPPEFLGSHVASARSHTTGRQHDLAFRALTALWGHLGVEWDLTAASADELAQLADWIAYFKEQRELLLTGRVVRDEVGEGALWLHGVVARDASTARYMVHSPYTGALGLQGRLRLPGLQADTRYRVRPRFVGRAPAGLIPPPWFTTGVTATGAALANVGLTPPSLNPEQAVLLEVERC
ncbi:alpha-galactosidase [Buchananella hordeovulneris]|uniref:alpha-galactosidase n=1 Tax=Buchananella hordeovulneris TaxID=52770 RepID=A0A1Q5PWE6_9ACTO|nr:alpha-galactosidase [Buchananella hordeovulneris]OKL51887.1 hypothetical protein BSZ40_05210 [Buchananella hordeovulneris]